MNLTKLFFLVIGTFSLTFLIASYLYQQLLAPAVMPRSIHYNSSSVTKKKPPSVRNTCQVPPSGFKSWKDGVVTAVIPKIERSCTKLFAGDESEIFKVQSQLDHWNGSVGDEELLEKTSNCSWVRNYMTGNLYTTKLERSFPIAFTYVVYNSPQQILRLLRVHYRQHNVYCIHPDKKSTRTFSGIFHNIAACLDNVIIPKELINVVYGTSSVLEASMSCLEELILFRDKQPHEEKWKYVLNLCGKELPLITAHDIVEHLIRLNGSSSIRAGRTIPYGSPMYYDRLGRKKVPFGLPLYKSMAYVAISYEFANFLFTNETARDLYDFFKGCRQSEEHYYATVYNIPGVPGGYVPELKSLNLYFLVDNTIWVTDKTTLCRGKIVHHICIVSVAELKKILKGENQGGKPVLFHNKYFMEEDHVVMDCMEERLITRNKLEFSDDCRPLTL